ncbi:GNAT family N-acetyltransferase [Tsukamurella paurometabola]|uniref:Acetyltransferase (GNAT) family n=1 Tax=Tsukamurella paurometabola TaxID=2061 RepID=A0A3P8KZR8_TSUPA|nr:GNAT family N-acetyltransferase [Tsukamurella paurometabola]UEA84725.1 GNAT family N-acetyltransferase [Tsukamurella paurometabola]VDR37305.1 Acetyltransferase (GNAT) family [Tsukamurella paurometabola]
MSTDVHGDTAPGVHIRSALGAELPALARICAKAFEDDAFTRWMHPDAAAREGVLAHMFTAALSEAVPSGGAIAAVVPGVGPVGVSIWLESHTAPEPDLAGDDPLVRRMRAVHAATNAVRPTEPHVHLASMAVLPRSRGRGVGALMLAEGLRRAGARGLMCYLEASSQDNRRLYARNGFVDLGSPIIVAPDAPPLWPMWRAPR